MYFFFLFFCFLGIASQGQARISPAVELLDRMTTDFEQSPTQDKRKAILKFVFTGDAGPQGPYKTLSKRRANDDERQIMLRALDIVNRHYESAQNDEDGILNSYVESANASDNQAENRHRLICFMAIHTVFGQLSHSSLPVIIQNFRSKYWERIRHQSSDFDDDEVDPMFNRLYDNLPLLDDEEYKKPPVSDVDRKAEERKEEPGLKVKKAPLASLSRDKAAARIQALARGGKIRKQGKEEYHAMMKQLMG